MHDMTSTYIKNVALLVFVSLCSYSLSSQTLQGVVQNGTTGVPQSGDLVVVVIGNKEIGRTVTEKGGHFTINSPLTREVQGVLSIRVSHAGVTYSHPIRVDSPINLTVYDASTSREQVSEYMCVLQFQTRDPGLLETTELHAIKNDSWPRRTIVDADNVRLSVPIDARDLSLAITEADGQGARLSFSGNEIRNAPKALAVPLEPGLTKYVIEYSLPYNGHLAFQRKLQYRTDNLFLVAPLAMQVAASSALRFRSIEDHTGAQVREVDSLVKNISLTIQLRGNGVLSQAFSPSQPHNNNPILSMGSEASAPDVLARTNHAQIAAATSRSQRSGQSPDQKRWGSHWVVLGCAVLLSIVIVLGKAIYVRKARQST